MLKRTSLVAVVLIACLYGVCWSAEWRIAEQTLSADEILNAKILKEERLESVAVAGTVQGPRYILNAQKDGYILLFVHFHYGNTSKDSEAVAIDTKTGEATKFVVPKGLNRTLSLVYSVEDDRGRFLGFMPGRNIGQLWCYDPAKNTYRGLGTPTFERGRGFFRTFIHDGKVWGTVDSKSQVGLWHYDLKTEKFHSYGFITPLRTRGGETHAYTITGQGDYIYLAVGKIPWQLYAYNRKTAECTVILEAPAGNAQLRVDRNIAVRLPDPKDPRKRETYELLDGKAVQRDQEWVNRMNAARAKGVKRPPPRPKLDMSAIEPTADGTSVLRYQLHGEEEWKTVTVKVKTYPQSIRRLVALPDGKLLGAIASYKGAFLYDTRTGRSETVRYRLSQYATVIADDKVYMGGYPSSQVFVFDPNETATPAKPGGIPVRRAKLVGALRKKTGAHKMWGAAVGNDGRIYFCGERYRDGNGGGFGWWDPKEEEMGGLPWETFVGHKLFNAIAVQNGGKILLSSHTSLNNLTGKVPESAKIFVYDVKKGEIIKDVEPIVGAAMLGPMVEVSPGRIISVANMGGYKQRKDCVLFGLDANTMEVAFRRKLPVRVLAMQNGKRGGQGFLLGPDGHIWTCMGAKEPAPSWVTLVRIAPDTAEISIVGRVRRRAVMAFVGKDLYRGCEHGAGKLGLRRLAGIVP